jgi:hypothetical protein
MRLRRIPVNALDDRELFQAKLEGSYGWMGLLQTLVRSAVPHRRLGGPRQAAPEPSDSTPEPKRAPLPYGSPVRH